MDQVIRHIHRLAGRPAGHCTDEELLHQFFACQNEDAIAMLIRRHGAMVLGLCLRVLHHRQDAEDAFQATFMTLVRKGQSIRHPGALSSWLYRVAFRVALRAKDKSDQKSAEILADIAVESDPGDAVAWRELRPIIDTEVHRLPAKYRAPMILCYLEGKTYDEAAGELGCPKGTVAIRLLRGKLLLKNRLARRGLALSAGLIASTIVIPDALAAVPPALQACTIQASMLLHMGASLGTAVPSAVAGLVKGVAREFAFRKLVMAVSVAIGVSLTSVGIGTTIRSWVPASAHSEPASTPAVAIANNPDRPTAVPPVAPPPVTKLDTSPKNLPAKVEGGLSVLIVQWTIGELVEADHPAKSIHRTKPLPQSIAPASSGPSGKPRHPGGLALRESLADEDCPRGLRSAPLPAPSANVKSTFVYRFVFANGAVIRVIIIDPV